jgi:hypothetical protein
VAGQAARAELARDVLARFGIDIDSAPNGAFLEEDFHAGLHTNEYYNAVDRLLSQATSTEEALDVLQQIRYGLQSRTFP